jgi:WD40 repeat protein
LVWDTTTWKLVKELPHPGHQVPDRKISSVAFNPGGNLLATATHYSPLVAMYDTASGQRLWNFVDTTKFGGRDVAFAPDGASVYVGNTDFSQSVTAMALHKFDILGNRLFSRSYTQGNALARLAVDGAGNVVAIGTATPLLGSAYRD